MSLQPWRRAIVTSIKNETADTRVFRIQVPEIEVFSFEPGQFVTLDLPIHEKANKRWRSYSIASNPNGSNEFELLIVLNPQGLGTTYLFNEVQVGSELILRGPQGVFTLKQPLDKDVYLICTGTGIAPFRSMIKYIHQQQIPHQKITLIYGCRKKDNLLYYDELKQLENEMQNFVYIPTLSREEWEGRSGYVHHVYQELCDRSKPAMFYLCGWREMIDEAKQRILDMGFDKKDIHLELYG